MTALVIVLSGFNLVLAAALVVMLVFQAKAHSSEREKYVEMLAAGDYNTYAAKTAREMDARIKQQQGPATGLEDISNEELMDEALRRGARVVDSEPV